MTDPGQPSVCLVVLNWNGRDDTLACLDSLRAVVVPHDVIVVDNASADGTVAAVESAYPSVLIIQTGRNAGFAEGNNIGLEVALSKGYDIVGILNNDTIVSPNFLAPLIDHLGRYPGSAVSPRIEYLPGRDDPWFARASIDGVTGLPLHRSAPSVPEGALYYDSELLTGCCLLATRETWRRVGLLDARFFLIFEDSDWCIRASEQASGLHVVPGSTIYHKVSTSFKRTRADIGIFYWTRNALLFRAKHRRTKPASRGLVRLMWHVVVKAAIRDVVRSRDWTAAYLRCEGMVAFLSRHWGPAPRRLQRLAEVRTA